MFSSWVEYGIPGGQLRLERWWGARISGRGGSHEGAQGEQAGDQADPRGVWSPEPGGHGPQKRMSSPTAPAPGGQRKPGLSARALPLLTQRTRKSPPPRPRPVLIREVVCTARENEALSRPEDSKAAERDGGGTQWAGGLPVTCLHLLVKQRAWRTGRGPVASRVAAQGGSAAWPCPWGACHPAHRVPACMRELPPPRCLPACWGPYTSIIEPPD